VVMGNELEITNNGSSAPFGAVISRKARKIIANGTIRSR
jgi:hypothetical protein